jgi:hypothetical protein
MPDQAVNTYNVGDLVALTATFATVPEGVAIDPTGVVITICDPDLNESTPTVENADVGVYTVQVSPGIDGKWRWRATGTGAAQASKDGLFIVAPQTF